jgi:hypothetical protein
VLQVGSEGQPADALRGTTHQATAQAHLISIRHGNNLFTLSLNRAGGRGGSIAVKGPPGDLNEPLPETVEDHWRYFKDDPNFTTWMTDPRYRAVIEPDTGTAQ